MKNSETYVDKELTGIIPKNKQAHVMLRSLTNQLMKHIIEFDTKKLAKL